MGDICFFQQLFYWKKSLIAPELYVRDNTLSRKLS